VVGPRDAAMSDDGLREILPFDAGSFTFAEDERYAGEEGVVVAHALRDRAGRVRFAHDRAAWLASPERPSSG